MATQDHYNWPTPSRNDTMYLNTIKPGERSYPRTRYTTEKSPNLHISDIEKAQPTKHVYDSIQKEVFANRNDDIAGSHPKKIHQPMDRVYHSLKNDDIAGTRPQRNKFITRRTPSNPLNPEYKLPKVEVRVPTPPKFIRDSISTDDIEGSKPNLYSKLNLYRETNNVKDIEKAWPRKEWIANKWSSLDVRDINYFREFRSKRETNPLSPRYRIVNQDNELHDYGKVDNKVLVRHPKEVNKAISFDLTTKDIEGAQAGASTQHLAKILTRDTYMKTKDVPGAQTSTLKKGMSTLRQVNPLYPMYVVPGHSEPAPVYLKTTKPAMNSQALGTRSASCLIKRHDLPTMTPGILNSSSKVSVMDSSNFASSGDIKARPSVDEQFPKMERKATSPLIRVGQAIMKQRSPSEVFEHSGYVPSLPVPTDSIEYAKQVADPVMNLEAKSPQKIVKNFFSGSVNDQSRSMKSLSIAEKLDKYISK